MGTLFVVGGTAGAAAAGLTNPLDLITTRLMAQGEGQGYGRGILGALKAAQAEGRAALWRGTLPRMAAAFPYAAIQFALFEMVMTWLSPPEEPLGSEWGPPRAAQSPQSTAAAPNVAAGSANTPADTGDEQGSAADVPKRRRRNTSSVFGFAAPPGAALADPASRQEAPPPHGESR